VTKFESVLAQAMELDEDERLFLALQLDASVPKDADDEEARAAEIKRRLEELDRGEADEMDWDEAMKEIFDD
jgi:hypothetical protein